MMIQILPRHYCPGQIVQRVFINAIGTEGEWADGTPRCTWRIAQKCNQCIDALQLVRSLCDSHPYSSRCVAACMQGLRAIHRNKNCSTVRRRFSDLWPWKRDRIVLQTVAGARTAVIRNFSNHPPAVLPRRHKIDTPLRYVCFNFHFIFTFTFDCSHAVCALVSSGTSPSHAMETHGPSADAFHYE